MTKLLKYSRTYHWLIFLCLTLPFFYTGCDSESQQTDKVEFTNENSINFIVDTVPIADTISQTEVTTDSVKTISTSADTLTPKHEEKLVSQKIANRFPIVKPILIPKKFTLTGLAILIDSFDNIEYFSFFLFWLLLTLSLILKYLERNALKAIVLFDTLSLLFLLLAKPAAFESHRLFGVWLSVGLVAVLIIFDVLILKNELKKQKGSA